jgi:acetylornithine deacetylase/succinyl-diaminopimelate desuccinylase-like protein
MLHRGGDAHFDTEFVRLVRFALADALDLWRVQGIDLAAALAALLLQHAPGQEQRLYEGSVTLTSAPRAMRQAGTYPPFSGHFDPEKNAVFGGGAMDDKAGAAISLGLMRVLVEQRLRFDGDLIFQFVREDEITSNGNLLCREAGMRHFAKRGIPCLLYGPGCGFNPHRVDEVAWSHIAVCCQLEAR